MVYEEVLLKEKDIPGLRPPALLCTNRQVRNEALPLYYYNNTFYLHFYAVGDIPQTVQRCINVVQATIEKHVRHIELGIHRRVSDLGPYNDHLQCLFEYLPDRFFFPEGGMGKPKEEFADYSWAKEQFSARLKEEVMFPGSMMLEISENDYDGKLRPLVLRLFDAVWLLVHAFPEAKRSMHTVSYLPNGRSFHEW